MSGSRNRFVEDGELYDWLRAADIYVTPYTNVAQSTSGTLAYAYGLGKPIVSTPYWHASELLARQPQQLVDFGDPDAFAAAILRLLEDDELRAEIGAEAWRRSRSHTWPRGAMKMLHAMRTMAKPVLEAERPYREPAMPIRALGYRLAS